MPRYPVERFVMHILSGVWFVLGCLVLAVAATFVLVLAGWQALDH